MARVEEPELHELIRFDVLDELRADPFPGRPPERKAVLDDPLAEGLAHHRPAVGKAVSCREPLGVGRARDRWRSTTVLGKLTASAIQPASPPVAPRMRACASTASRSTAPFAWI